MGTFSWVDQRGQSEWAAFRLIVTDAYCLGPTGRGPPPCPHPAGSTVSCFGKSKQWEMCRSGTDSVKMTLAECWRCELRHGLATQMLNCLRHTVKLKSELPNLGSELVGLDGICGPSISMTYIYLFIWLCRASVVHAGSLVAACGILFPDEGSHPGSLHCQCGVLATGPQEKSLTVLSDLKILQFLLLSKDTEHVEGLLSIRHFWLSHLCCQSCL